MSKIDSIKEDFNIGDPIRITCSLGIKEGYIIDIKEDRIKLRPFNANRKPISIAEDNIGDFEEAFPPSDSTSFFLEDSSIHSSSSLNAAESSINKESIIEVEPYQDSQETISTHASLDVESNNSVHEQEIPTHESINEESITQSDDKTTSKTEIRVGSIKLTSLGKIDLSKIPMTKKEKGRKNTVCPSTVSDTQVESTNSGASNDRLNYYENTLDSCKSQLVEILSSENINLLEKKILKKE